MAGQSRCPETPCRPCSSDRGSGPVHVLQRFVRDVQEMAIPSGCRALRFKVRSRDAGDSTRYRSTVRFVLDGVPHSVVGTWQRSHRHSQRAAADRALDLIRHGLATIAPEWSLRWTGDRCRAVVRVQCFGALHQFEGAPASCATAAAKDMSQRLGHLMDDFARSWGCWKFPSAPSVSFSLEPFDEESVHPQLSDTAMCEMESAHPQLSHTLTLDKESLHLRLSPTRSFDFDSDTLFHKLSLLSPKKVQPDIAPNLLRRLAGSVQFFATLCKAISKLLQSRRRSGAHRDLTLKQSALAPIESGPIKWPRQVQPRQDDTEPRSVDRWPLVSHYVVHSARLETSRESRSAPPDL
uniref:Uncharacterized protein n=1 Tax=Noctiluca scintillans TaxID=2966 RepID=A0A7S1F2L8_NOCSC|mmetsp:Transcript_28797/g.75873  ORF Transcript_28797/g.75873 Transcript_28797/m.75873 type:complete len:351 (+) Transcript_28797:63-1115(+)